MSEANKYARARWERLRGTPASPENVIEELELAFRAGAIHGKEKAIETIKEAFGADFAKPLEPDGRD